MCVLHVDFVPQSKLALWHKVDGRSAMDPQEASTLLARTTLRARRQLAPSPPWLLVLRAVLVLAACGAVWLSVRGQHPYRYPTVAAILGIVAFGIVNLGVTVAVARRATTGVHGRSRLRPA